MAVSKKKQFIVAKMEFVQGEKRPSQILMKLTSILNLKWYFRIKFFLQKIP